MTHENEAQSVAGERKWDSWLNARSLEGAIGDRAEAEKSTKADAGDDGSKHG